MSDKPKFKSEAYIKRDLEDFVDKTMSNFGRVSVVFDYACVFVFVLYLCVCLCI